MTVNYLPWNTQTDETFTKQLFIMKSVIPLQIIPSPAYPGLHVQVYDPLVLLQSALLLHLCFPVRHSLLSRK